MRELKSPRNHLGVRNGARPGLRCPCHTDESHRTHIKPPSCERERERGRPLFDYPFTKKKREIKWKKAGEKYKYDYVEHIKADLSQRNWFIGFPDILVVVVMLYLWGNCRSLSLCSPNLFYILLWLLVLSRPLQQLLLEKKKKNEKGGGRQAAIDHDLHVYFQQCDLLDGVFLFWGPCCLSGRNCFMELGAFAFSSFRAARAIMAGGEVLRFTHRGVISKKRKTILLRLFQTTHKSSSG